MKLRLPDRLSKRTRRVVVVCLAAALVAPFAFVVIGPFAYFGASAYLKWHHGYGVACTAETLAEAVSPSHRWIARTRLVSCGGVPGDQWVDAVLVPNVAVPFLTRYREVFAREIADGMPDGGDRLAVRWVNDHSLELHGAPCMPCQSVGYHRPCDPECRIINDVSGITVSLKPLQN
jgi:hypothetical protein